MKALIALILLSGCVAPYGEQSLVTTPSSMCIAVCFTSVQVTKVDAGGDASVTKDKNHTIHREIHP